MRMVFWGNSLSLHGDLLCLHRLGNSGCVSFISILLTRECHSRAGTSFSKLVRRKKLWSIYLQNPLRLFNRHSSSILYIINPPMSGHNIRMCCFVH